jgi:thiol-disulfide isomerase/thioredoxin
MKKLITLLTLLLSMTVWATAQEPAKADAIVLPTLTGKQLHIIGTENGLKIDEYKGTITFLEFWGTHCPPCRVSIPHYIDLMNKYKGKLNMLAIEVQDTPKERLKTYAKEKGINYDVVAYRDAGYFVEYIARRAGWKGSIPFLIILDPNGNVVTMQVGLVPQEALERVLNDMLKKQGAASSKKSTPAPSTPAKKSTTVH